MKKKNTPKVYLNISNIKSLEDYYTQVNIVKAIVGSPQTRRDITEFIERITNATIDSLFVGNTVAIYKHGNNLIRIPKDAIDAVPVANPKKNGFFKRLFGKKK